MYHIICIYIYIYIIHIILAAPEVPPEAITVSGEVALECSTSLTVT